MDTHSASQQAPVPLLAGAVPSQGPKGVSYPKQGYTPEMLAYYRHRYAERCKDPAYKEKIRQYSRDARARKRAAAAAAAAELTAPASKNAGV